jgi:succinate dehydrogenase flavin-adding protein (antitoxin of CptAB toxin-antitoxin module)
MRAIDFLLEDLESEGQPGVENLVVVFGGRFQPPTKGHFAVYKWLVKHFGKKVFIATSDKTDKPALEKYAELLTLYDQRYNRWLEKKSKAETKGNKIPPKPKPPVPPKVKSYFNFEEKKKIWGKMFGIPGNKIIFSATPAFAPKELLNAMDENTAYVAVTSEKDADRYTSSPYFIPYPMEGGQPINFDKVKADLFNFKNKGYYIVLPNLEGGISATQIRNALQDIEATEEEKKAAFEKFYSKFDEEIFNLVHSRLNGEW